MGKADLHIHTNASDGALSPAQIVQQAGEKGLHTISITDHDTIKGYQQAVPVVQETEIELLTGVELTVRWEEKEVHLLGYCFDPEDEDLVNLLLMQRKARRERMASIVNHLQKQGIAIDLDEVKAEAGFGNIGRPHAAAVLIDKGVVGSFGEAFIRYLSAEKLNGIKTNYCTIDEAIEIVKNAGGVVSLAHPGPLYSSKEIDRLISHGLDALECIHPSHPFPVQRNFSKKASGENLLITGGSDYHGNRRTDYDPYFGIVTLGEQHVAAIKRVAWQRSKLSYKQG